MPVEPGVLKENGSRRPQLVRGMFEFSINRLPATNAIANCFPPPASLGAPLFILTGGQLADRTGAGVLGENLAAVPVLAVEVHARSTVFPAHDVLWYKADPRSALDARKIDPLPTLLMDSALETCRSRRRVDAVRTSALDCVRPAQRKAGAILNQSIWDDLREDARTFFRQNPQTGHTLIYRLPEFPHPGPPLFFDESMGASEDKNGPLRKLVFPRGLRASDLILEGRLETEGGAAGHGYGSALLWRHRTQVVIANVDREWEPLLDRLSKLSGEGVHIRFLADTAPVWPIVHRLAWAARHPTTFDCRVAWAASVNGHHCPGWIVESLPLPADFGTDPTQARKRATDGYHLDLSGEGMPSPMTLAGWWYSTVYPAGEALVAAIDWLRTADAAERMQAGLAAAGAMAGGVIPDTSTLPVNQHAGDRNGEPARADDDAPPALTANQILVIATMARFDGSRLLSAATIEQEMDAHERLSDRTIGPIVRRLVELDLAERPEGKRSGARLTMRGRRLAPKVAD